VIHNGTTVPLCVLYEPPKLSAGNLLQVIIQVIQVQVIYAEVNTNPNDKK